MNTIYFDMDGTIANLYGVENWLPKLRAEDATPYEEAAPMVDTFELSAILIDLQLNGYKIGIISWLAKGSTKEYDKKVRNAKKEWLTATFPEIEFDEMHFVKYGTRKDYVAKDKDGLIFDDDERVRDKWRGRAVNPNYEDIIEVLKKIREMAE